RRLGHRGAARQPGRAGRPQAGPGHHARQRPAGDHPRRLLRRRGSAQGPLATDAVRAGQRPTRPESESAMTFRYGFCNETFEGWDHADVCRTAAELGYQGLEIAPFTLAPRITEVSPERRKALRDQAEQCGLRVLGLHWLLAKTEGFHLNSADAGTRARTADYLSELARCCRDLGGALMVFGSPAQRRIPAGATRDQAADWAADTFRRAAPVFADCGVMLCLEPLSPPEADFLNTIDEAL